MPRDPGHDRFVTRSIKTIPFGGARASDLWANMANRPLLYWHSLVIIGGFRTLFTLACLAGVGCGGSPRITVQDQDSASVSVVAIAGDWNDLFASVDAVAERHALGVLHREQDAIRATIELIDVLGRPIRIDAERVDGLIELRIAAGRFGDAKMERRLREDLARRLSQLRDVDVAPLEWGG